MVLIGTANESWYSDEVGTRCRISLEEILNRLGSTASKLPRQYSKAFREQWSETGFQERIRGVGFRSDSAAE